ncbi:MerR family transcriptional regulator [Microbispora sp. NPDC049125]|uniref:MerR family transcriptional regulator n=1 Tax=Microbispora sp. NPDC049125 TaxID=3154929 RepID=UPI003467CD9A
MELLTIGAFAKASRLSPKALRLYDELGLLVPARTDPLSGYRMYHPAQLERARLVAGLRRLGMPLARIRAVCDLEPAAAAEGITAYWAQAEADHSARRALAAFLVEQLTGKDDHMFDVEIRDTPGRMVLSARRHLTIDELSAFGAELMLRLGDGTVPHLPGIEGAPFLIFYGEVGADSDGPVEWCRPVPADEAERIAGRFPDLELRSDPPHREAYVRMTKDQLDAAGSVRALQALATWAAEHDLMAELVGPPRQVFFADMRTAAGDTLVSDIVGPLLPE